MNFEGQVAICTGGASGMGLLFAQNWAAYGGNVVMIDGGRNAMRRRRNG